MTDKESKAIFEAYKQSQQKVIAEAKDEKGSTRSVAEITTLINHILGEKGLPPVKNHEEIMHAAEQLKGTDPVAGKRLSQLATDWEAAFTMENTVKPHLQQQLGNMNNPPIAGEQQGNAGKASFPPADPSPFIESVKTPVEHPRIMVDKKGVYVDKKFPNTIHMFTVHVKYSDREETFDVKAEDEQHARALAQIILTEFRDAGGQVTNIEERHGWL